MEFLLTKSVDLAFKLISKNPSQSDPRMSSPFGRGGIFKDSARRVRGGSDHASARRGSGGSDHGRVSFGSTRGSFGNAIIDLSSEIIDLSSAAIQKPVATDETNEAERPVKINNITAVTFLNKTEMVDLIVGPEEALFRVHKSFLCNKIPYFDRMFNGGFIEAKENSAKFPEDGPESFDILIEWVYSGYIRFYEVGVSDSPESWNFIRFYALAEKLGLTQLEDHALDLYRQSSKVKNATFDMSWATKAYEITPQGSALRRYAIQVLVWRFHTQEDSDFNVNDHFIQTMESDHDLFTDFMLALRKHVKVVTPTDPRIIDPQIPVTRCEYHGHTKDEDCYKFRRT
ncbi:hypothetical protein BHYA_0183g00180 [Botrytis hyacinthi]|uniref:BTB domain-containing protein n=1 Tax=Botrytis hyacinthi TaxID=278943 RepID=A0A4Z1GCR4_9HELO|nr:hypothetical protein BHYA_0183g00180 [Botrytis hyacinthi]